MRWEALRQGTPLACNGSSAKNGRRQLNPLGRRQRLTLMGTADDAKLASLALLHSNVFGGMWTGPYVVFLIVAAGQGGGLLGRRDSATRHAGHPARGVCSKGAAIDTPHPLPPRFASDALQHP